MPAPPAHDVTKLLVAWSEGNKAAFEQLVPLVYAELREVAHGRMRDERPDHVLQTTALIRYGKGRTFGSSTSTACAGRAARTSLQSLPASCVASWWTRPASAMRASAAARSRDVVFDEALMPAPERDTDLVALDAALEALANADPRKSQVVELRYFGGLSVQETAEVLGVSVETVARDWRLAKLWLLRELEQGKPERPDGARADCGGDGRP